MYKIPRTEEELRVVNWWNGLTPKRKDLETSIKFGVQKSYRRLNYQQVKEIYKRQK